MNFGIIAVLCIFDVVFAIAVIVWNLSNKNRCKDSVEEVIESTKEKDVIEKKEVEEVIEKPVRIKDPIKKANEEPAVIDEKVATRNHHSKQQPLAGQVAKEEEATITNEVEEEIEPTVIEPTVEEIEEPQIKETVIKEPTIKKKEEPATKQKPQVEEIIAEEEQVDKEEIVRLTFAEKLMSLGENVQGYYNQICNVFYSYRHVNRRVSNACVSFRNGRDLVAKLSIRGKTMKLHLALKIKDYDESLYFQKDYSDVKQYAEVPFTVKVKSDRGLKRALELIASLAVEKEIQAKARYNEFDALLEIKEKLENN